MKKLFGLLMLLGLAAGSAHAAQRNEEVVRHNSRTAHYLFNGITASTSAILIDLSDTTNFKHAQTGEILITGIRFSVDKVAASSATVMIGVVTFVDASTGTVKWFVTKRFAKDSVLTHFAELLNPNPAVWHVSVNTDGTTPLLVTNETASTNDATYQTDVNLPTSAGNQTPPGVGDIIIRVVMGGATALSTEADIFYYTER